MFLEQFFNGNDSDIIVVPRLSHKNEHYDNHKFYIITIHGSSCPNITVENLLGITEL